MEHVWRLKAMVVRPPSLLTNGSDVEPAFLQALEAWRNMIILAQKQWKRLSDAEIFGPHLQKWPPGTAWNLQNRR